MESVARFIVAVSELFEAEGLELKRQIARLIAAAGLGLIILGLVAAGLGLLLFSLYRALAAPLTPTLAIVAVGVAAMLLAWGAILYARHLLSGAISVVTTPDDSSRADAKVALIDGADATDPLAPMRKRPFIVVGVAAGIGAALGMNFRRLIESVKVTRAMSSFVRGLSLLLSGNTGSPDRAMPPPKCVTAKGNRERTEYLKSL